MLNYETDRPLRQVAILLTPEEAQHLLRQLTALVASGNGYARVEDEAWGELDISLYTPETIDFLHRRTRRLVEHGE